MEQSKNFVAEAATDEPAFLATSSQPAARISDQLTDSLIEEAIHTDRRHRFDGWTPDRIRAFLDALAQYGVVADAARAAGMSARGAYAFRNSAGGRAFDLAWRGALLLARKQLADQLMSRAVHGCVEVIMRDGEKWGERHRYDNRLSMAVLTRLDALAKADRERDAAPAFVANEFEQFVDIVCAGGEEAGDFIRDREEAAYECCVDEAEILDHARNYMRAAAAAAEPPQPADAAGAERSGATNGNCELRELPARPDPEPSTSSTLSSPNLSSPAFAGEGDREAVEGPWDGGQPTGGGGDLEPSEGTPEREESEPLPPPLTAEAAQGHYDALDREEWDRTLKATEEAMGSHG